MVSHLFLARGSLLATLDDSLGVGECHHYQSAVRALDVEEIRVGGLDQALELVSLRFFDGFWVK